MAVYQWSPPETFEAKQINTLQDLNDWIAALTPNELGPKGDYTFTDLAGEEELDGEGFIFTYHMQSEVDGPSNITIKNPWGVWAMAGRLSIRPLWFEDNASFTSRFEPYSQ